MKIKLRTFIIIYAIIWAVLILLWRADAASLSGGETSTVSQSLWRLYKYRDTTLMRKAPMKWCPYLAYQTIHDHVKIEIRDNRYWIVVDTDITALLSEDAAFNKAFAKAFKVSGTRRQRIRQIYQYCRRTQYTAETTYARDVFTRRQGDCAAIASAFYVLCKAKHIPVRYVIGWAHGCHAWNRVKVGKRWLDIDCTMGFWLQRISGRTVMEIW